MPSPGRLVSALGARRERNSSVPRTRHSADQEPLKIPERIDLFVGEIPYGVMRRHRIILEELGQTIMLLGETGLNVELVFGLEDFLAE
jgi:hypothetical protein